MRLVELIKQISQGVLEGSKPMMVCFGTVVSLSPLQVRLSQKLVLGEDFFIIPQGMAPFEMGETLILLQDHGGQQYLMMGRKG